jgi:hypothetical protein
MFSWKELLTSFPFEKRVSLTADMRTYNKDATVPTSFKSVIAVTHVNGRELIIRIQRKRLTAIYVQTTIR